MSRYFAAHVRRQRTSQITGTIVIAASGAAVILGSLGGWIYLSQASSGEEVRASLSMVAPPPSSETTITVLRAKAPIEVGTPLTPDLFTYSEVPIASVPAKAIRSFSEVTGHYAFSRISANQPLLTQQVTPIKPINSVTAAIPHGYRAVTITVDEKSGVEGWARPGATVDVIWTSQIRNSPGVTVIVQNAKVLSAQSRTEELEEGAPVPSTVTLLVTAPDAAKIQLGSTTGLLGLSLRGDTDTTMSAPWSSLTTSDLLSPTELPPEEISRGRVTVSGKNGEKKVFNVSESGELVPLSVR